MAPRTWLVVPCFDEADRLVPEAFHSALQRFEGLRLLFVDDGSRDDTLRILEEVRSGAPDRIEVLELPENRGKAAAVRLGVLRAIDRNPGYVGYWDADLATPLPEVQDFVDLLEANSRLAVVMGARVKLLGRDIRRSALRHDLGRVFATCVSMTLDLGVYDTQCGAKLFRADPELIRQLFAEPFRSTWIFDVEILARLIAFLRSHDGTPIEETVYEYPLTTWRDVEGSKVKPVDFFRSLIELAGISRRYAPRARRRVALPETTA